MKSDLFIDNLPTASQINNLQTLFNNLSVFYALTNGINTKLVKQIKLIIFGINPTINKEFLICKDNFLLFNITPAAVDDGIIAIQDGDDFIIINFFTLKIKEETFSLLVNDRFLFILALCCIKAYRDTSISNNLKYISLSVLYNYINKRITKTQLHYQLPIHYHYLGKLIKQKMNQLASIYDSINI